MAKIDGTVDGLIDTSPRGGNRALFSAKAAKQDEFYTQYVDIQKEVEAYLESNPEIPWWRLPQPRVRGVA